MEIYLQFRGLFVKIHTFQLFLEPQLMSQDHTKPNETHTESQGQNKYQEALLRIIYCLQHHINSKSK